MVTYKFNQPYYELHLSGLSEGAVHVLSYEGEEEISNLFEYRIEIISEDPELDSSKILNNPATFVLNRGDEDPIKIHGIISHFEQHGRTTDYVFYKAILVPQIWRLNLIFQNEVYQDLDIEKLIEMIMEDIGLSQDYMIDLKNAYPIKEYIAQYRETNLNFLHRRLEHLGIYYYFDHSGETDVVVFTDSNNKLSSISVEGSIGYNQNKDPFSENESISEITCREKIVTGMVQVKDYNYMFPEKQLMAQSQINNKHPGLYYDYGDDFENEKDAESLAKIRNQEFLSCSKVFYGKSDCRYFSAGHKFKLEKHYRESWNGEYVITKVTHKGNQHSLFALLPQTKKVISTYENNFTAIPADIEFRPQRKTPIPKISGIMSAKIDSGDDEILIDEHGRYFAKMFFDLSDKANGEATLPIRLTQGYSGAGYGIHFPNHGGTELLWACVDGNVDRPVGIGTIPNPSNASPSTSGNKTQNVIRTAGDNEIIIEDKGGDEQIHIKQACGNEIHMKASGPDIEIKQTCGNEILMKASGPDIEIKQACGNQILMKEAEGIHVKDKYGNEVKLDAAAGFIRIASPTHNSFIEVGKSIEWATDSNDISLISGDISATGLGSKNDILGGNRLEVTAGVKNESVYGFNVALNYAKDVVKNYLTHNEESKYKNEKVINIYKIDAGNEFEVKAKQKISFKVGGSEIIIDKDGITLSASKILLIHSDTIKMSKYFTMNSLGEIFCKKDIDQPSFKAKLQN